MYVCFSDDDDDEFDDVEDGPDVVSEYAPPGQYIFQQVY